MLINNVINVFKLQNRTNSDQLDDDDDETVCKNDCHIKQVRCSHLNTTIHFNILTVISFVD